MLNEANCRLLSRANIRSFRDIFCAGRVTQEDLNRTVKACGGTILTTVNDIRAEDMGICDLFEEVQIGNERFVLLLRMLCSKNRGRARKRLL